MSRFQPYKIPTANELEKKKEKSRTRLKGQDLKPIVIEGKTLGRTWWGKAWNHNLESYADYSNRISRGKSYVRQGMVIHLTIEEGQVFGLVQGRKKAPYEILVKISPSTEDDIKAIGEISRQHVESFESLLHGEFPKELEVLFTRKGFGLFPSPKEIDFYCSCPDHAYMCKHVAAVLYGIGSRLDEDPQLFFTLRQINGINFIKESIDVVLTDMLKGAGTKTERTLSEENAKRLFGLDEEK
ncbi:MAG: hypothetical protein GX829_12355 [Clostridium sp.]|nr:hypothetical protein [Clostridium sp.]